MSEVNHLILKNRTVLWDVYSVSRKINLQRVVHWSKIYHVNCAHMAICKCIYDSLYISNYAHVCTYVLVYTYLCSSIVIAETDLKSTSHVLLLYDIYSVLVFYCLLWIDKTSLWTDWSLSKLYVSVYMCLFWGQSSKVMLISI